MNLVLAKVNMRNIIIFLVVVLFATSCSVLKDKKDIEHTKTTISEVYRKGDTLKYSVPNIKYKDTTIYIRNFEKERSNTLKITYDKQGNEVDIVCMSEEIKQLTQTVESLIDKTKVKETKFNPINFIYIFLGLGFLLFVFKKL